MITDWSTAIKRHVVALIVCLATSLGSGGYCQDEIENAAEIGIGDGALEPDDVADDLDSLLDLAEQDIERLATVNVASGELGVEVTTVTRQKSTVGRSPAAVYVISNEMIRRSGARTIPDALRLAPGLNVARIDSNKWAISIRGFNSRYANKLLVQIDGRSVYTPLFGGVYWDTQDVLLEDVDRIEIIRGPGATIWGANAVNGIINVITKSAEETQGMFVEAGGGTYEQGYAGARYGGKLSNNASYRVWGKWFERDEGNLDSERPHDDWRMSRGGFRVDWKPVCQDHVTVQGEIYDGASGQRSYYSDPNPPTFQLVVDEDNALNGGYGLVRWTRTLSEDSDWSLQAYFDSTERNLSGLFHETVETFDLDFQHHLQVGCDHNVIWGAGYRHIQDRLSSREFSIRFDPGSREYDLFSFFVQDEINLWDEEWFLTLGSKFQHNDYTGVEIQPTARLLWVPNEKRSFWSSVSRAVRTPTRSEDDMTLAVLRTMGVFPSFLPSRSFDSEELIAYEFGARAQETDQFSWDFAAFFHDYDKLASRSVGTPFPQFFPFPTPPALVLPFPLGNDGSAETYGCELVATYELNPCWKIKGAHSFLKMDIENAEGAGFSPEHQFFIQSSNDIGREWSVDTIWRFVDELPGLNTDSYNTMDLRVAWHPNRHTELAIVGRNLLDKSHPEFGNFSGTQNTEVAREVYGMISCRY